MAGRKRGPNTSLNRDLEARLLGLLRAGVPREVACEGAGIDSRTLRAWREKERLGDKRYESLNRKIEQALAEGQSAMLIQIRKAGGKDWKALAWMLERCFSERYGYRAQTKVTVEAELEKLLDVAQTVLGDEAAAKLFAAISGDASFTSIESAAAAPTDASIQ